MRLTSQPQGMLAGRHGKGCSLAMKELVGLGGYVSPVLPREISDPDDTQIDFALFDCPTALWRKSKNCCVVSMAESCPCPFGS